MAGLYLASQSPRRTELLTQVGIDHTVVSSTYEESNEGYDNPIEMVKAQALGKARCAVGVPDGSIVLGADTIVVLDNKVLGKPHDESDARHMLEHLSGRAHSVITGVALLIKGEEIVFHNETKVYFKEMSPNVLNGDYDNKVEIDIEAQKKAIITDGLKTDGMTDLEILQYPTGDEVYLTGDVRFVDTMASLSLIMTM